MKQNLGKTFQLSVLIALGLVSYMLIVDRYYLNYSYFREDVWLFQILKIVRIDRYFEMNNLRYGAMMIGIFSLIQFQVILSCPISERMIKVKQKVFVILGLLLINMLAFLPLYQRVPWKFFWFFIIQLAGWQLVLFLIDEMKKGQVYYFFLRLQLRLLVFIVPLFLIGTALFLLIGSPVINFVVEIILTVIPLPQPIQLIGNKVLVTFAIWLVFLMELAWVFRALTLFYLSENERIFGRELKKELTRHGFN
jgi:hypothetical protein